MRAADAEVIAVRYGTHASRRKRHFHRYSAYSEPDAALDMDFYFWVIRSADAVILVDTGFRQEFVGVGSDMGLVTPVEALAELGISRLDVSLVILTHLHFDHMGNLSRFPKATFVVQEKELAFWLGPLGAKPPIAADTDPLELGYLRDALGQGRVRVIDGRHTVAPGVSTLLVGGHCPGEQLVIVEAERSIVLASDALHFYEEMERDMVFATFSDLPAMYAGYATLRSLADDGARIVAGHDPQVMKQFPAVEGVRSGLAVRLD